MFPLGSVLFPHMPLRLRVFEERYLIMLSRLINDKSAEFGVVLIERGQEVGGGEHRFTVGTMAAVMELGSQDGVVALTAQGTERIEVAEWLDEDPYPQADVRTLPPLVWDPDASELLEDADRTVRRALIVATEFDQPVWPADVELADEPVPLAWQLAGIAPIGPLDQLVLLRSTTIRELLEQTIARTAEAVETWSVAWGAPEDD